jgi:hypothetical protein
VESKVHKGVYGKGEQEFRVTIGCGNPDHTVIYQETLRVRADSWRAAARYVKTMDRSACGVTGALLRECKSEPGVLRDRCECSRVFFGYRWGDMSDHPRF